MIEGDQSRLLSYTRVLINVLLHQNPDYLLTLSTQVHRISIPDSNDESNEVMVKLFLQISAKNEAGSKSHHYSEIDLQELLSPFEIIFKQFGEIYEEATVTNSYSRTSGKGIKLVMKFKLIGSLPELIGSQETVQADEEVSIKSVQIELPKVIVVEKSESRRALIKQMLVYGLGLDEDQVIMCWNFN